MSEEIFWDRNSGYGVFLDEYHGNYSLIAGREREKVYYKDWVFLSRWQNGQAIPDDKRRPMGVYLGSKEKAIEALEYFLNVLNTP